MNNRLDWINRRLDIVEEQISKLEDIAIDPKQRNKTTKKQNNNELWVTSTGLIYV